MRSTGLLFSFWFALAGFFLMTSSARALEPPILRLSLEEEPTTLDWNDARAAPNRFIISFLMRGLLRYDTDAKLVCDLCSKYETTLDGKVLRFQLKPDVLWSDGVKVESQQFVDSFRRLLDPSHHFDPPEAFLLIAGARQPGAKWDPKKLAVKALSSKELEITLIKPLSIFADLLTSSVVFPIRKDLLRGVGKDPGESHLLQAGLGPYVLGEWKRGTRLVIEGNPTYTSDRPVYRVEFILGKHAQQVARFKSGKIDILSHPTTEDLLKVPGQKIQVSPYWATRNLIFNIRRAPLSSQDLRKAILHSLDRDSLPADLRNGERKVTGLIPPGLVGNRELPLATADLNRARAEKSRALGSAAKAIDLDLLVNDREGDRRVASWLSDRLQKIQIHLKVRQLPMAAYLRDFEKGNFDLVLNTWTFDIANPMELLRSFQTGARSNRGHWTHVGFDALLGELYQTKKPAEFAGWVDQLTQILEVQDVGVIPLGYPTEPFLLGPRVISFAITPFGDPDLVKIELKH